MFTLTIKSYANAISIQEQYDTRRDALIAMREHLRGFAILTVFSTDNGSMFEFTRNWHNQTNYPVAGGFASIYHEGNK